MFNLTYIRKMYVRQEEVEKKERGRGRRKEE
jgi:hypothetical protein